MKTDIVIMGSGIGGLASALNLARQLPKKEIVLITKGDETESNTKYAQGGIAIVRDLYHDSFEKHITDTLIAGDGLCDKEIVKMVVEKSPGLLENLIRWGVKFDKSNGQYDLHLEGGHSASRVVHYKDKTGFEIEMALLKQIHLLSNIKVYSHSTGVDFITKKIQNKITYQGVYVYHSTTHYIETIFSEFCVIATGGIGQLYLHTTNPAIATGDGIAMAYRSGAEMKDMEFVQFHPTALYESGKSPMFLISEAVRGFGAKLKNADGKSFMLAYDKREELASRDIVSRAIFKEMQKNNIPSVYLDCRHLNPIVFAKKFPIIYKKCKGIGLNITYDMIPVVPAAHYLCGGIAVDRDGQTSIDRLFACGECARTGLHGANRLASNSLLEALAFADNISEKIVNEIGKSKFNDDIFIDPYYTVLEIKNVERVTGYKYVIKQIMSNKVGVIRTNKELQAALAEIIMMEKEITQFFNSQFFNLALNELKNMITVAKLVISHSLIRRKNKGTFYNEDL